MLPPSINLSIIAMEYMIIYWAIFQYYQVNLQLIKMLNDTKIIVNINFITNFFLKLPKSIIVFFTSNMGPTTKNPSIELIGKALKKPLATNASEVEQTESKKDNKIITRRETLLSLEM